MTIRYKPVVVAVVVVANVDVVAFLLFLGTSQANNSTQIQNTCNAEMQLQFISEVYCYSEHLYD